MASTYESKTTWTSWRKANYAFFEERLKGLDKRLTLVDFGSGPEQFRDITWRFDCISLDFKQFGTTKIVADLTKPLPLRDQSADIVFMSNVLEHLPWGLDVLRECHRILKKDGMIIGTIPFISPTHQEPHDYNRYTHYMLSLLLKNAKFDECNVSPIGKPARVYLNIQDEFFSCLRKTVFSNNTVVQFTLSRLAAVARISSRLLLAVFYPLYLRAPENLKFTQGYGFVGFKREHADINPHTFPRGIEPRGKD